MNVVATTPRHYLSDQQEVNSWEDLQPIYDELLSRNIEEIVAFKKWLSDLSEVEAFLEENVAWRYIKMTINTADEKASDRYKHFVTEIQPKLAPYGDQLNRKLVEAAASNSLKGEAYRIYLRGIRRSIEIFREENISLNTKLQELSQEYSGISGAMMVEIEGETLTMQQAAKLLQDTDRDRREMAFRAMTSTRMASRDRLEDIFDEMVKLRHQVSLNAGFTNFRDYKFAAMGRFDYRPEDCFAFHKSIEEAIVPIAKTIAERRKNTLGYSSLRPWDMSVDVHGRPPLKPFETADQLINSSITVFDKIDPFFGACLQTMKDRSYLDLASKEGKAPGGYNYPLYESGIPFIFMNAVGTVRDLVTMMHEGGHAIHSVLSHPLALTAFKGCPSEVAELASMSMELISMNHWNEFFSNDADLIRAKREHLEDILSMLPWIAMVDAFQHWIYTNPEHSREERKQAWLDLNARFSTGIADWSGLDDALAHSWHRQLHIFEVPFYYIEYGMAQLGAVAVWRHFKNDPKAAIEAYKSALSLGYTATIGDIYESAGIRFDFSKDYISELAEFVQVQLSELS